MNQSPGMGQVERVSKLFIAALLSLSGIVVAMYRGANADWEPVGQLLSELLTAGAAAVVVRWLVDKLKARFPSMRPLSRYWLAMALSASISPLAYLGLVSIGLSDLTEHGAVLAATAAFATATTIHKELEGKKEQETSPA